jgi:hypothetical protein
LLFTVGILGGTTSVTTKAAEAEKSVGACTTNVITIQHMRLTANDPGAVLINAGVTNESFTLASDATVSLAPLTGRQMTAATSGGNEEAIIGSPPTRTSQQVLKQRSSASGAEATTDMLTGPTTRGSTLTINANSAAMVLRSSASNPAITANTKKTAG